nr:hypothetical protein Iba_chr08bCG9410 [Ipomoea batatas]
MLQPPAASVQLVKKRFCSFICRPANSSSRSMEEHPRHPTPHQTAISIFLNYCLKDILDRTVFKSLTATHALQQPIIFREDVQIGKTEKRTLAYAIRQYKLENVSRLKA